MDHLTEPTLLAFLLQALPFTAFAPLSYLAYRWVRVPLKRDRVKRSLARLGIAWTKEFEDIMASEYHLRHYAWPLLFASVITFFDFSLAHPYVIQRSFGAGFVEEVINVFGADDLFSRVVLAGRFQFWAWLGASVYSFQLITRRFLSYDLKPGVYVFSSNRFMLAFAVASIVCIGLGTFSTAAGVSFDVNMATVCIVAFFIGFFPSLGINWIGAMAQKALGQQSGLSKEMALSKVQGLSIWQQGRLKQEGIENVQNLAAADVPTLIISTPFTVNQIIDWVDQAILLVYASQEQFEALTKVGLRCASDVLTAGGDSKRQSQMTNATGLNEDGLRMLYLALQSAPNIEVVSRFGWQSSMDKAKQKEAAALRPFRDSTISLAARLPREQEEIMFEEEE